MKHMKLRKKMILALLKAGYTRCGRGAAIWFLPWTPKNYTQYSRSFDDAWKHFLQENPLAEVNFLLAEVEGKVDNE